MVDLEPVVTMTQPRRVHLLNPETHRTLCELTDAQVCAYRAEDDHLRLCLECRARRPLEIPDDFGERDDE